MIKAAIKKTHGMNQIVLHTKPHDCGGKCRYCFSGKGLSNGMLHSETIIQARDAGWSPTEQMRYGEGILSLPQPVGNKFSITVKGDSFTNYPVNYLERYLQEMYDYLNGEPSETFEDARRKHATAPNRCGYLSVTTRPDMVTTAWCEELIRFGVSSVELGVQNLYDTVLEFNNRGHGREAVVRATELLKKYGFEVGYHMMPGLPYTTREIDVANFTSLLWEDDLFPDYIKFYPCVLLKNNGAQPELASLYDSGKWAPLTDETYADLLRGVLPSIPRSVYISRYQRIIPEEYIAHGPAKYIGRSQFNGIDLSICQRSFQHTAHMDKPFSALPYRLEDVAQGKDVCVQALLPDDTVLAYMRLSFYDGWALLRDIRVLGRPYAYEGKQNEDPGCIQHKGIGKGLLARAETLAKIRLCQEIRLYPLPGAEHYFVKQGYQANGMYSLSKKLM